MKSYLTLSSSKNAITLELVSKKRFTAWRKKQPVAVQTWLDSTGFAAEAGKYALLPDAKGKLAQVMAVIADTPDIWSIAGLSAALPVGVYRLAGDAQEQWSELALGWQLGTYCFDHYKKSSKKYAVLHLPEQTDIAAIEAMAEGIFLARDLINRPANDLTPYALADAAKTLARQHGAKYSVIKDEELLKENYPLIHAVGRASDNRPCLVDMRWGNEKHPKVTLVGKGICFDSGGLDIKPSSGMLLMKKDMGGAANVLALAHAIMAAGLPVRLRVLIAAAENSVGGNAFRPKDIIRSRKGLTVEIGNTDAEGRLVLCDALTEADSEKPDLLLDMATLTGAARVALGTDVPAFFTHDDKLADALAGQAAAQKDPLWRLPLWMDYRESLVGDVSDLNNAPGGGYGGAITAALYLNEFVEQTKSWLHVDLMAWNIKNRAGRPVGGEAMGVRALFALLSKRYDAKQ
jgi:leucyl aminopeptidase